MGRRKRIALVAHDNKKRDLVEWAIFNKATIAKHSLYATGTTGNLLEEKLGQSITKLQSGPLGGDLQIGALIAEGKIKYEPVAGSAIFIFIVVSAGSLAVTIPFREIIFSTYFLLAAW